MNYPLSPAQKQILADNGRDVNFAGDDNDFGCLLSEISRELFLKGERLKSFECYNNDPMACFGVTYQAWEKEMLEAIVRRFQNEATQESHARSMELAG